MKFQNLDDNQSAFFVRELEYIKGRTYDIKYPQLKARQHIPVSFAAGAGAQSITYRQYSQFGIAKLIANYADDLPRADIGGKEFTSPVRTIASSFGYNYDEIQAAAEANMPLRDKKASAARRAVAVKENRLAYFGDAKADLLGLYNHPNVGTVTIPADGTGSATTFASKTADQILRDLHSMATAIHEVSQGLHMPDTLLLPLNQFNLIWTKRLPDSDMTVGKHFLENSPHVSNIDWSNELKGAGAGGTDVMFCYERSPEIMELEIPSDFKILPVQERNLEYISPCHERFGGVTLHYPLAVAKGEGI